MKTQLNKFFLLLIILLIVIITFVGYAFKIGDNKSQQISTQNNTVTLWNAKIADTFDDEPQYESYRIASSSAWIVPSDPDVIKEPYEAHWIIRQLNGEYPLGVNKEEVEKVWESNNYMKESLDKFIKENKLGKPFYDFFYQNMRLPITIKEFDVTGDGVKDQLFQSIGTGCASCHTQFIDINTESHTYSTSINEGTIYPRQDRKGFYLDNMYTGKDFATCCSDNVIISKYEWNGIGFTEVARKRILFSISK